MKESYPYENERRYGMPIGYWIPPGHDRPIRIHKGEAPLTFLNTEIDGGFTPAEALDAITNLSVAMRPDGTEVTGVT